MDADEKALFHQLFELYQSRDGSATLDTMKSRLRRMETGLTAEDHFAVLLTWLGRCRFVHKLNQEHSPTDDYRVPDILAVFDRDGRPLPVLIEVKATQEVDWKPAYLAGLQRYSAEVGLPVLLAWKHPACGLWALCELRHLKPSPTNYKITFPEAMANSLMCALAGDFSYTFTPGLALHLDIKKLGPTTPGREPDSVTFPAEIERAYYALQDGQPREEPRGLTYLFTAVEDEASSEEEGDRVHQTFTSRPGVSQLAHRVLPSLIALRREAEARWRDLLLSGELPMTGPELMEGAASAARVGIIERLYRWQPRGMPEFLK